MRAGDRKHGINKAWPYQRHTHNIDSMIKGLTDSGGETNHRLTMSPERYVILESQKVKEQLLEKEVVCVCE